MEKDTLNLSAAPLKLDALIDYSSGSIISKTLFKSPNNNLTLFSFDQGQELSEHISTFNAYVLNLEGEIELRIGGAAHQLKKGDFLLMPAGVPHALRALSPVKILLIMMK